MKTNKTVSVLLLIVTIVLMFIGGVLLLVGCLQIFVEFSGARQIEPAITVLLAGFVLVGGGVGALVLRHRLSPPTRGEEPKAEKGD
jgi:hypothetical protein